MSKQLPAAKLFVFAGEKSGDCLNFVIKMEEKLGKFWKYIDIFVGVLLMFFIPSMALHVKAREREFEICIARVEDYLALFQRQGYCTKELLDEFCGIGKGVLGNVEIELQYEPCQGSSGYIPVGGTSVEYLEEEVYPFYTGDILKVSVRMGYDGIEKLFFGLCAPKTKERFSVKVAMVRDGLYSRIPSN